MRDIGIPPIEERGPAPIDGKMGIGRIVSDVGRCELIDVTLEAAEDRQRREAGWRKSPTSAE